MVGIKALSVLAVAGSAIAAPQGWFHGQGWPGSDVVTVSDVVYTTVVVTVTAGQEPTSTAAPPPPPAATTTTPAVAAYTPPAAASSPAAAVASSAPSTGGYMDIVNEYRSKMGLKALIQDSTLEGNALKTCDESGGQLKHELNPGSMAQVLAPGTMDNFEKIFVGGWLCEVPSTPGLDGICSTMSQGWDYEGQTGHNAILTSPSYSKIGCAAADGVCGCDLA